MVSWHWDIREPNLALLPPSDTNAIIRHVFYDDYITWFFGYPLQHQLHPLRALDRQQFISLFTFLYKTRVRTATHFTEEFLKIVVGGAPNNLFLYLWLIPFLETFKVYKPTRASAGARLTKKLSFSVWLFLHAVATLWVLVNQWVIDDNLLGVVEETRLVVWACHCDLVDLDNLILNTSQSHYLSGACISQHLYSACTLYSRFLRSLTSVRWGKCLRTSPQHFPITLPDPASLSRQAEQPPHRIVSGWSCSVELRVRNSQSTCPQDVRGRTGSRRTP